MVVAHADDSQLDDLRVKSSVDIYSSETQVVESSDGQDLVIANTQDMVTMGIEVVEQDVPAA